MKQNKTNKQEVIATFFKIYNNLDSNILIEMSKIITE
jgi:hypothetical protein